MAALIKAFSNITLHSVNQAATADELWKGITTVSNAGKRKGRMRGLKKRKNLNRFQELGEGNIRMNWPGLNTPISGARTPKIFQHQEITDEEIDVTKGRRDLSAITRRAKKIDPLDRGWAGTRLPGQKIGPPDPILENKFENFETIVLEHKRVCHMNARFGRVYQATVFCVTGNGNGLAGYALTRSPDASVAIRNSKNRAGQRLHYFNLCDDHTEVDGPLKPQFEYQTMEEEKGENRREEVDGPLKPQFGYQTMEEEKGENRREGYGLICHRSIEAICKCIGIKDIHVKLEGAKNIQNMTKAFFFGLHQQKTHSVIAEEKGLNLVEFREENGEFPTVVASPTTCRKEEEIANEEVRDYNEFLKEGRERYVKEYKEDIWRKRLRKTWRFRNREDTEILQNKLEATLSGLLTEEGTGEHRRNKKIAVGFGACLDLIGDSSYVFDREPPKSSQHHHSISNEEQFREVFSYFFRHGAAGERYMTNATLFSELVAIAAQLKHAKWVLGGNAPVMATRFAMEGAETLLGAQVSDKIKQLIPKHVQFSGTKSSKDDIHLIMEYESGATWGPYKAPRANRFIVHSDTNNPIMASVEAFRDELVKFKPDLVVISGLQMMDNYPFKTGERLNRLEKMRDMLIGLKRQVKIHFEMASFSDASLFQELTEHIIPYVDSLGMNEQELPNLHSNLIHGNLSLISPSHPRIASVLDQMRDVFRILETQQETNGKRKLSRLHVHTLAYQAIMVTKESSWKNTMSATAKASLTANRHVCGSKKVDTSKAKLIMDDSFATSANEDEAIRIPYDETQPVSCWTEDTTEVCIAPVLVCTEVRQTAGCGDNISSAGLIPQI
ncbi:ADP-dependent glucokinase [Nymphon striatum]|nr:ADP-dependent glucokinase [Nymphon striatum]